MAPGLSLYDTPPAGAADDGGLQDSGRAIPPQGKTGCGLASTVLPLVSTLRVETRSAPRCTCVHGGDLYDSRSPKPHCRFPARSRRISKAQRGVVPKRGPKSLRLYAFGTLGLHSFRDDSRSSPPALRGAGAAHPGVTVDNGGVAARQFQFHV
jgi:hypothetical protein